MILDSIKTGKKSYLDDEEEEGQELEIGIENPKAMRAYYDWPSVVNEERLNSLDKTIREILNIEIKRPHIELSFHIPTIV